MVASFSLVDLWLSRRTRHIGSCNSLVAELAFRLWMFLLVLGEWTTSDNNFGVTGSWTMSRRNRINVKPWLSILKEFILGWSSWLILCWFRGRRRRKVGRS